ncbi:protein PXR1-like isoform X2 [Coccinella septempunctata]|uniref:protein PXR1-like isoform X2 n=1 Tax=Coccinella septempunctata TaxID=41139 RepID=UPI001D077E0B|nr:protein PXR1-like isoform X2 [Coccinella septempunctata]
MNGTERILENTISYLYKISEALPKDLAIPKSYYASKCRILELKGGTSLPSKLTGNRVRCPRCCLNLTDYPPKVHLKAKRKQDKFTRKMFKRVQRGQRLTSYQQKFKQLLPKMSDKSALIRTCLFCKKEIETDIKFQKRKSKTNPNESTTSVQQKKRKKKKDKYAGLIPSACITLDETIEEKKDVPVKKSVTQILHENVLKQKEEAKIKYNVVGNIKDKKKKKRKSKKIEEKVIVKSTKMKIDERKQRKAERQKKNKIENLLSATDKPKASNILSGFLESL